MEPRHSLFWRLEPLHSLLGLLEPRHSLLGLKENVMSITSHRITWRTRKLRNTVLITWTALWLSSPWQPCTSNYHRCFIYTRTNTGLEVIASICLVRFLTSHQQSFSFKGTGIAFILSHQQYRIRIKESTVCIYISQFSIPSLFGSRFWCLIVTFPLVSWVRCGTRLYRFLIFALFLSFFDQDQMASGEAIWSGSTLSSSTEWIHIKN